MWAINQPSRLNAEGERQLAIRALRTLSKTTPATGSLACLACSGQSFDTLLRASVKATVTGGMWTVRGRLLAGVIVRVSSDGNWEVETPAKRSSATGVRRTLSSHTGLPIFPVD
jgi:hypothetical protein